VQWTQLVPAAAGVVSPPGLVPGALLVDSDHSVDRRVDRMYTVEVMLK
jgi:hypothetical protein